VFKNIIFDFDLTLADSLPSITLGLRQVARHFGLPKPGEEEIRQLLHLEAKDFWTKLWGRPEPAWNSYFLAEMPQMEKQYLQLIPGARELLQKLKKRGRSLALATNRDNPWAALTATGLAGYFDTAVGARDVARGKPAPDMILLAARQLEADPDQTVYIGDSTSDMAAAAAAGLRGVGLLAGSSSQADLIAAGAWQVCPALDDLANLLLPSP
jgi:HAD superfamily hydrolase (TIGR01509 family)